MKKLAAATCALLMISLLGCSEQSSTVPALARPADPPPTSTAPSPGGDVNTFGDSKDPAADAAQAREQSYGNPDADSSPSSAPNRAPPPPR